MGIGGFRSMYSNPALVSLFLLALISSVSADNACGAYSSSTSFTANLQANGTTCINLTASNIILDCNGYTISGNNAVNTYGVYVTGKTNVTVKNCRVTGFDLGIYFFNGSNWGVILNNTVYNNSAIEPTDGRGIMVKQANNAFIANNTVFGEWDAIRFHTAYNSTMANNEVYYNVRGLTMHSSNTGNSTFSNNTAINNYAHDNFNGLDSTNNAGFPETANNFVINNTFVNNYIGIMVSRNYTLSGNAINQSDFQKALDFSTGLFFQNMTSSRIYPNNTINGKPIVYYDGIASACPNNQVIDLSPNNASAYYLIGCTNVTLKNGFFNRSEGVRLFSTNNSVIRNVSYLNTYYGPYLAYAFNNLIENSSISSYIGVTFGSSPNNTVNSSTISGSYEALDLSTSNNDTIMNSNISGNQIAFYALLFSAVKGIQVFNNTISDNDAVFFTYANGDNSTNFTNNVFSRNGDMNYPAKFANSNNSFLYNSVPVLSNITVMDRISGVNASIPFNISFYYLNGTPDSAFTVNQVFTYPSEGVNWTRVGNNVSGNFSGRNLGLYSLFANVSDPLGNNISVKYNFLINSSSQNLSRSAITYYVRAKNKDGTYRADREKTISFNRDAPSADEALYPSESRMGAGAAYMYTSLDRVSQPIPGILRAVNISMLYKSDTGITLLLALYRSFPYSATSKTMSASSSLAYFQYNFTMNWTQDYFRSWWDVYADPLLYNNNVAYDFYWKTNSTYPSTVVLLQEHTVTPDITSISSRNIDVISASTPSDDQLNATISLMGNGNSADISVAMQNNTVAYSVQMDGNNCDSASCNYSQTNGTINVSISSVSLNNITTFQDVVAPSISLYPSSISNNSYAYAGSIPFFYNVTDLNPVLNCSLSINGTLNSSSSSITKNASSNFTISLPTGFYNWSISCSDIGNNTASTPVRTASIISLTSNFSGNTTNFTNLNVGNVSNLTLEKPALGRIVFTENIDLSSGFDIDAAVNISSNRIAINSSLLPALNRSANLTLYGISFSNPRILMDGSLCPSSVCSILNYSGGTLLFNVTHFSVFSSEDTPGPTPTPTPEGGSSNVNSTFPVLPPKPTPNASVSPTPFPEPLPLNTTGNATVTPKPRKAKPIPSPYRNASSPVPTASSRRLPPPSLPYKAENPLLIPGAAIAIIALSAYFVFFRRKALPVFHPFMAAAAILVISLSIVVAYPYFSPCQDGNCSTGLFSLDSHGFLNGNSGFQLAAFFALVLLALTFLFIKRGS